MFLHLFQSFLSFLSCCSFGNFFWLISFGNFFWQFLLAISFGCFFWLLLVFSLRKACFFRFYPLSILPIFKHFCPNLALFEPFCLAFFMFLRVSFLISRNAVCETTPIEFLKTEFYSEFQ